MTARRRDTASGPVPDSASTDAGDSDFGHKKTNLAVGFGNPTNSRNSPIGKLQVVEFGSHLPTTCNWSQVHDFIGIQVYEFSLILDICEPLYHSGQSIREISSMTGFPKTTILDHFKRAKLPLRAGSAVSVIKDLRQSFKSSATPPFGYFYLEGRLQKDAKEFKVLQIIWQFWQRGQSATSIMRYLNEKKLKTRSLKEWKRTTVLNILERFENKTIVLADCKSDPRKT